MEPFRTHTGIAVPLIRDDIDTDQIAPVAAMRNLKLDYKALLFMRTRRRDDGSEEPEFVLNKPQFRNPSILVTGHNFGAGSSREAAVWSMLANNIRVIVARSFADIYRENCLQNGLLPVVLDAKSADAFEAWVIAIDGAAPFTVDLQTQRISGPAVPTWLSISRPRTACASSKAWTISVSPSSTPTISRTGSNEWRRRSRGCKWRGRTADDRAQKIPRPHGRQAARTHARRP